MINVVYFLFKLIKRIVGKSILRYHVDHAELSSLQSYEMYINIEHGGRTNND